MRKRNLLAVLLSLGVLTILLALVAVPLFAKGIGIHAAGIGDSGVQPGQNNGTMQNNGNMQNNGGRQQNRNAKTINGLDNISVVASTMFVLDAQGRTVMEDANPYGIAIAPAMTPKSNVPGSLRAGDLIVTNFGGNQTGKTLVRIPNKQGPARLFNTMQNKGTNGPADEAFNTMNGLNWVANTSGNNIQVFGTNGNVLATITNPMFNMPWGQAFNNGIHNRIDGSVASFFSTNAADGTIDRIDLIPAKNGAATFKVFQIGQLAHMGKQTFIALTWLPSLQMNGALYSDVLLATDTVNNRIAAYPNSSTRHTQNTRSMYQGVTVFKGMPLQGPAGFTISPTTGDLLVVNSQKNNLVELNMSTGKVVGTVMLDNVPVDAQSGNGSALFGVVAAVDNRGNLAVYFTDDNTNTVNVLHRS